MSEYTTNGERNLRRKCDDCEKHPDMEKSKKENADFRLVMKTGVSVAAFFILSFMGWMVYAHTSFVATASAQQEKFEKEQKQVSEKHKEDVSIAVDKIQCQVKDILNAVTRIEGTVNTLVETNKFERSQAKEERERNRKSIEEVKAFYK